MPTIPAHYTNPVLSTSRPRRATRLELRADRDKELRFKRKIDQADRILTKLEERISQATTEIARLQQRKALWKARTEGIEDGILSQMDEKRISKLFGFAVTLSSKPSGTCSVVIDDAGQIPDEFMKSGPKSPDKIAIRGALLNQESVPGVHLEQTISLLRKKSE